MASELGLLSTATLLLWAGCDVNSTAKRDSTALMVASGWGRVEMVALLLAHGAEVNAANKDGDTALLLACYNGKLGVVELLVEAGADMNRLCGSDESAMEAIGREIETELGALGLGLEADSTADRAGCDAARTWKRYSRLVAVWEFLSSHGAAPPPPSSSSSSSYVEGSGAGAARTAAEAHGRLSVRGVLHGVVPSRMRGSWGDQVDVLDVDVDIGKGEGKGNDVEF